MTFEEDLNEAISLANKEPMIPKPVMYKGVYYTWEELMEELGL